MDAETREKVKALEARFIASANKLSRCMDERNALTEKNNQLQNRISAQADTIAELSDAEVEKLRDENIRLVAVLRDIANGRGKYARQAEKAIEPYELQ